VYGYKLSRNNPNVENILELMICITHTCVVLDSEPFLQTYLQGTSITEGEGPGFLASVLVDSIEVDRSFLLGLTTRQKCNA
jgi:hypothetical protein